VAAKNIDESITAAIKKKTSNSDTKTLTANTQTIEGALKSETAEVSNAKIKSDTTSSAHDTPKNSSQKNEKKGTSSARAAESATQSAIATDPSPTVTTTSSAAVQGIVNATMVHTNQADAKIDIQGTNSASNTNSDGSITDTLRVGSSTPKAAEETAQRNGNATGTQFDRVRFVQRVEQAFAAISDRGGSLRMKLSPPELGSMRIEISVRKGVMKAKIEAETPEAKILLLENLPALRDRLAQQDIKIQQFDVDLRDPSSGGMSQQTAQQSETGSHGGNHRATPTPAHEKNGTTAAIAVNTRLTGHNGQLNVII
jgi:flagellar hook-length control protein FliK